MKAPEIIRTASDAIEIITAPVIAAAVGTDERTVMNKGGGKFPSWWFPHVSDAAKALGREVSTDAFNFARKLPLKTAARAS